MSGFRKARHATVTGEFDDLERELLVRLTSQLRDLLEAEAASGPAPRDSALLRLLPDAYPGDADASAEFRRFTAEGVTERKVANASVVIGGLEAADAAGAVHLDKPAIQSWLRTLTDLRLVLADRLGIERDDDEGRTDEEALPMQQLYFWFGYLQESLLEAMD